MLSIRRARACPARAKKTPRRRRQRRVCPSSTAAQPSPSRRSEPSPRAFRIPIVRREVSHRLLRSAPRARLHGTTCRPWPARRLFASRPTPRIRARPSGSSQKTKSRSKPSRRSWVRYRAACSSSRALAMRIRARIRLPRSSSSWRAASARSASGPRWLQRTRTFARRSVRQRAARSRACRRSLSRALCPMTIRRGRRALTPSST